MQDFNHSWVLVKSLHRGSIENEDMRESSTNEQSSATEQGLKDRGGLFFCFLFFCYDCYAHWKRVQTAKKISHLARATPWITFPDGHLHAEGYDPAHSQAWLLINGCNEQGSHLKGCILDGMRGGWNVALRIWRWLKVSGWSHPLNPLHTLRWRRKRLSENLLNWVQLWLLHLGWVQTGGEGRRKCLISEKKTVKQRVLKKVKKNAYETLSKHDYTDSLRIKKKYGMTRVSLSW